MPATFPTTPIKISETLTANEVAQALTTFVLRKREIPPPDPAGPPNCYETLVTHDELGGAVVDVEQRECPEEFR
ncbi:MAG: hypothetical protein P4M05_28240 [Bradyrhizobium sp.]|nr:hypothetical protein [Bradyrhizobium sp.]